MSGPGRLRPDATAVRTHNTLANVQPQPGPFELTNPTTRTVRETESAPPDGRLMLSPAPTPGVAEGESAATDRLEAADSGAAATVTSTTGDRRHFDAA